MAKKERNPYYLEIGRRIQALRERRQGGKWIQKELARHIGVEGATISQWETGLEIPGRSSLQKLASVFDESVDFLLHGPDLKKRGRTTGPFEATLIALHEILGEDQIEYLMALPKDAANELIDRHELNRLRSARRKPKDNGSKSTQSKPTAKKKRAHRKPPPDRRS